MKLKIGSLLAASLISSYSMGACPAGTTSTSPVGGKETCLLKGTYTSDLSLTKDKNWLLNGLVNIGNDNKGNATLKIEAGTRIMGLQGADFLVITRGSKIIAEGTQSEPIVFTSAKSSRRAPGSWGGLVLNGNAPINACKTGTAVCEAESEGGAGTFGGNDPFESSGVLHYVVVEWGGYPISPDNEVNGITFNGIGSGTDVDYVQVHMNSDDGIEVFGGTVNLKHVVLTGNVDDSLDWDFGWQGKVQYLVAEQDEGHGNNGIEADNLKSPMDASPRSNPTLSNMTFIGTQSPAAEGGSGMLLRRGTSASIFNTVVTHFKKSCIDIDDNETFKVGATVQGDKIIPTGLVMENSVIDCTGSTSFTMDVSDLWSIADWFRIQGNIEANPELDGWIPVAGSILVDGGETPSDFFFDEVDYIGAIKDAASDWTQGWTTRALD